jgi:imidazolonepropionase-like amidohydrolase
MGEPLRITNVNVFDSLEGRVGRPFDVTVGDGMIASVRPSGPGEPGDPGGVQIDGAGKSLMPGLTDAHWHTAFTTIPAASGPRNPYPGRLGVVAEGAMADLILVDGNPVADSSVIGRPEEAFLATIKAGSWSRARSSGTASDWPVIDRAAPPSPASTR